jgi:hypothetical protein
LICVDRTEIVTPGTASVVLHNLNHHMPFLRDDNSMAIMSDKHFTARVPLVTTTTRTYSAKVKVGPSIPFPGFASAIEVRGKSPFEKYRPNVKIETSPDRANRLWSGRVP